MRFLTPTLLAAQKEASSVPFVRVTLRDRVAGAALPRWQRLYSGGEPNSHHAAAMPGDGSLLRARVDTAGPSVMYQRVAAPGAAADFSSWTDVGSAADAGVAQAASGANAVLAYVAQNGINMRVRESSDYGATLGGIQIVAGASSAIGWVAAEMLSDGMVFIAYSVGGTVHTLKKVSGVWTAAAVWPYSASEITGLAATHAGDVHLAIAAVDDDGSPKLWTAVYGDGFELPVDGWSPLREVSRAESGSDIGFRAPRLAALDVHRMFFVEEHTGNAAYARPQWTWLPPTRTFSANAWREPVPFDLETTFGVAVTGDNDDAWLSTPSGVWRASLATPAVDVSDDILEVATEARPAGGRARIVLRNDDGRYNDPLTGPFAIARRAEVALSLGFVTRVGSELALDSRYWLEGWEHASSRGEATLTLFARDGWSLLERWRARRQHAWSPGSDNVSQILRFIFSRAGLELLDIGSSAAADVRPSFTVHPGESGTQTARRLLAMTPDAVRFSGGLATLYEPLSSDEPSYAYGTDHAILRTRVMLGGLSANRAQVFGPDVLGERFDWQEIEGQLDLLDQVHDLNMTSVALAEQRADAVIRQVELTQPRAELVAPVNCGLELYDVLSVTEAGAGLSSTPFRVSGIDLTYARRRRSPVYQQRVILGSV